MFLKLISILLFVTIYNAQQSECGDDLSRLGPFGYNILDDVLAKYYSRNGDLSDPANQLLEPVQEDDMDFKVSLISRLEPSSIIAFMHNFFELIFYQFFI